MVDIDEEDDDGRTALHWAARNGHALIVRKLCAKGADMRKVTCVLALGGGDEYLGVRVRMQGDVLIHTHLDCHLRLHVRNHGIGWQLWIYCVASRQQPGASGGGSGAVCRRS